MIIRKCLNDLKAESHCCLISKKQRDKKRQGKTMIKRGEKVERDKKSKKRYLQRREDVVD